MAGIQGRYLTENRKGSWRKGPLIASVSLGKMTETAQQRPINSRLKKRRDPDSLKPRAKGSPNRVMRKITTQKRVGSRYWT